MEGKSIILCDAVIEPRCVENQSYSCPSSRIQLLTPPQPNFPAEDKSHNLRIDVVDPILIFDQCMLCAGSFQGHCNLQHGLETRTSYACTQCNISSCIYSSPNSGIDCGLLIPPKNGDISFSAGTNFGSVATHVCNPPFFLEGNPTRVCVSSGVWSGEAPSCESGSLYVIIVFSTVISTVIYSILHSNLQYSPQ